MGGRDACVCRHRRGVAGGRVLPKQGLRGAGGGALRFGERRSLARAGATLVNFYFISINFEVAHRSVFVLKY